MFTIKTLNFSSLFATANDSMTLDSGTCLMWGVAERNGEVVNFDIVVRGEVRVKYKGDIYKCASDMPDDLLNMFTNGSAYNNEEVEVIDNNWFELGCEDDYDVLDYPREIGQTNEEIIEYLETRFA